MKDQFITLEIFFINSQMSNIDDHLKWCRWCDCVKSLSARKRHENKEHSFEKEASMKMQNFQKSKSFDAPLGYTWCSACHVVVENTVFGVSNHSKSMYHKSKSGRPLTVLSDTFSAVSKTAAAPQLQASRKPTEIQKQSEDEHDSFQYGAHEQSGACVLSLFFFSLITSSTC